ncbi:MAG TPA: hypothetical protein VHT52_04590 [Stellaceae bacterium]|nr:hypothetical protein [Stellaceae bacterium]
MIIDVQQGMFAFRHLLVSDGHTTFDSPVLPAEKMLLHITTALSATDFPSCAPQVMLIFGIEPG